MTSSPEVETARLLDPCSIKVSYTYLRPRTSEQQKSKMRESGITCGELGRSKNSLKAAAAFVAIRLGFEKHPRSCSPSILPSSLVRQPDIGKGKTMASELIKLVSRLTDLQVGSCSISKPRMADNFRLQGLSGRNYFWVHMMMHYLPRAHQGDVFNMSHLRRFLLVCLLVPLRHAL